MRCSFRFLGLLCVTLKSLLQVVGGNDAQVQVNFQNDSGSRLGVYWVHPTTAERHPMGNIDVDAAFSASSFQGHTFEFREIADEKTGVCNSSSDKTCRSNTQNIGTKKEQRFVITQFLGIEEAADESSNNRVLSAEEMFAKCRADAKKILDRANGDPAQESFAMTRLNSCLTSSASRKVLEVENEVRFESDLRVLMSGGLENFTCTDTELETSPDVETREWTSEKDGVTRPVHVKLDRNASRIHVIENFAYPEECDAMEETAAPILHHASVADGKGGTQQSEHRKAMQAGIRPRWNEEHNGDLVTRLSRRVYDYTNHVLGLDLSEKGQEPLMSIQYNGRGYDDLKPDRYTPHCDGDCVGAPHMYGSRMATMVIYCTIPEKGGHTNFQSAGVHVRPTVGSAIFFSYIDPGTNMTDGGLTTHSGCPVFEGEKKIVTQWVRYGVDEKTTHSHFNTLGILHSEDGE